MILNTSTDPWTVYESLEEAQGCPSGTTTVSSETWCHNGQNYKAVACCVDPQSAACGEKLGRLTAQAQGQWPPNC